MYIFAFILLTVNDLLRLWAPTSVALCILHIMKFVYFPKSCSVAYMFALAFGLFIVTMEVLEAMEIII